MVKGKKTNMADTPPPSGGKGARSGTTVAVTPVRGGDPPVEGAPGSSVVTAPTVSGPVVYAAAGRAPVSSTPVVMVPIMSARDGDPAGEGRDYAAEFLWGSRLGEQMLAAWGTQAGISPRADNASTPGGAQSPVTPRADSFLANPVATNPAAGASSRNVVIPAELFAKLMGLSAAVQPRASVPLATPPRPGVESPTWKGKTGMGVEFETPEREKDKQRKGYTKLKPYDNKKEPFESYLQRFETHAKYYKWDSAEKMFQLQTTLGDAGGTALWDSGELANYEVLVAHLTGRFGSGAQVERFGLELTSRRRRPGETIHELYEDVKRLMALAHPALRGRAVDSVAMQAFAAAVDNHDMKKAIVMQGPQTMEQMCDLALRWEATEPGGKVPEITYGGDGRKREKSKVNTVEVNAVMGGDHLAGDRAMLDQRIAVERILAEVRAEAERVKTMMRSQLAASGNQTHGFPDPNQYSNPHQSPYQHPYPNQGQNQYPPQGRGCGGYNRGQGSMGGRDCFYCGKAGHIKRDCRARMAQENAAAGRGPPSTNAGRVSGAETTRSNLPRETMMEIEVAGRKFHCLLDSGCDHSLMPRSMLPDIPLQPVSVDVRAANGSPIRIEGCVDLTFSVGGQKLNAIILVSSDVTEFMLGIDWLSEQNVNWKFGEGKLELHGQVVPLTRRPSRVGNGRISVRESVSRPEVVPVTEEGWGTEEVRSVLPDPDEPAAAPAVNSPSRGYTRKGDDLPGGTRACNHHDDGGKGVHTNPTGVSNVGGNKRERVDRWKVRKKRSEADPGDCPD